LLENRCGFGVLVVLRGFYVNARNKACESNEADRYQMIAAPPLMHRKGHAGSRDQPRHQDDHAMCLLPPKVLKSRWRQLGVAHRVLDIFVPEVGLQRPRIMPPIGQGVTAGMAEHVRVHFERELGRDPRTLFTNSVNVTRPLGIIRPLAQSQSDSLLGWVISLTFMFESQ